MSAATPFPRIRARPQLAACVVIAFLGKEWAALGDIAKATWAAGAESLKISGFNEYVRINARNWRDQLAPSQDYPAARALAGIVPTSITATVNGRQVELAIVMPAITNLWGVVICRSLTTGFTAVPSNAIGIVVAAGVNLSFVDGPLPPDTYYYNAFSITTDGTQSADNTEESAIVA